MCAAAFISPPAVAEPQPVKAVLIGHAGGTDPTKFLRRRLIRPSRSTTPPVFSSLWMLPQTCPDVANKDRQPAPADCGYGPPPT